MSILKLGSPKWLMKVFPSLIILMAGQALAQQAPWPIQGWAKSSSHAQGLDNAPFSQLDSEIKSGKYGYIERPQASILGAFLTALRRSIED